MKNLYFFLLIYILSFSKVYAQFQQDWQSLFDGTSYIGELSDDEVNDMTLDNDGNVYLTGLITDTSSAEFYDALTIKYNNDGSLSWFRTYDRANVTSTNGDVGNSIALDAMGNVYVAGYTSEEDFSYNDLLILKYSNDDNLLWEQSFSLYELNNLDFSGDDEAIKILIDSDNNILVAGFGNNEDMGTGFYSHDFLLLKYNANGDLIWLKTYDYAADLDEISDMTIDSNNNIYVIGQSNTSSFNYGMILQRYAPDGSPQWFYRDDTPNQSFTKFFVESDNQDNIVIAYGSSFPDSTDDDIVVTKFNSNGTILWSDRYDNGLGDFLNTDIINDMTIDNENNIIVTGTTIQPGGTYNNYLTIKYSASGVREWVNTFDGIGNVHDNAYSIALDSNDNIFIAGVTGTSSSQNYYDAGIIEYSSDGDSLGFSMRDSITASSSYPEKILIDNGDFIITGNEEYFSSYDIFTLKFSENPTDISENDIFVNNYHLYQNYPNPFNPETIIKYSLKEKSNVQLKIYNMLGEEIKTLVNEIKPKGNFEVSFNAIDLPSGVYFYRIQAGNFSDVKKMILIK